MRLTPPSIVIFAVSIIIALLAVLAQQGTDVPVIGDSPFWSVVVAWGLLVIGCLFRRI